MLPALWQFWIVIRRLLPEGEHLVDLKRNAGSCLARCIHLAQIRPAVLRANFVCQYIVGIGLDGDRATEFDSTVCILRIDEEGGRTRIALQVLRLLSIVVEREAQHSILKVEAKRRYLRVNWRAVGGEKYNRAFREEIAMRIWNMWHDLTATFLDIAANYVYVTQILPFYQCAGEVLEV